jgi:hypothetical protein
MGADIDQSITKKTMYENEIEEPILGLLCLIEGLKSGNIITTFP